MNTNANPQDEAPRKPQITVSVSSDRQEAELRLTRLAMLSAKPLVEDVMAALAAESVVAGIDEEKIKIICDSPSFDTPVIVARGVREKIGHDGRVDYKIATMRELKPKQRENGTVDYYDMGYVQNVYAGAVLCDIFLPEKGTDGFDVYGNMLEGRVGQAPPSVAGKNTAISSDGTKLIAQVNGDAQVTKGIVNIEDTIRVRSSVDNSTGNIVFVGDVIIDGDVMSGFTVSSEGSITIGGFVEAATLEAKRDIAIRAGVNGMGRGRLTAGGSIKCKFIQNCDVIAGGNINTDTIMYSTVTCSALELDEKRGMLVGGRTTVYKKLSVANLGTSSHVITIITVASEGAVLEKKADETVAMIKETEANLLKAEQGVRRYEDFDRHGKLDEQQKAMIPMLKQSVVQLGGQLQEQKTELENIKLMQQKEAGAAASSIYCRGDLNVGVRINFGPLSYQPTKPGARCRVYVSDDEIVTAPL